MRGKQNVIAVVQLNNIINFIERRSGEYNIYSHYFELFVADYFRFSGENPRMMLAVLRRGSVGNRILRIELLSIFSSSWLSLT